LYSAATPSLNRHEVDHLLGLHPRIAAFAN
jgi:hypothetical protein